MIVDSNVPGIYLHLCAMFCPAGLHGLRASSVHTQTRTYTGTQLFSYV